MTPPTPIETAKPKRKLKKALEGAHALASAPITPSSASSSSQGDAAK